MKTTYQDYCANNLISYSALDNGVVHQVRKYLPDMGKTLDLRRTDYSSIVNYGLVFEFYYRIIQRYEEPYVFSYNDVKSTELFDARFGVVDVSQCYDSNTAKWLAYILHSKIDNLNYKDVRKMVLNYGTR